MEFKYKFSFDKNEKTPNIYDYYFKVVTDDSHDKFDTEQEARDCIKNNELTEYKLIEVTEEIMEEK